jgi:hypothetical protein
VTVRAQDDRVKGLDPAEPFIAGVLGLDTAGDRQDGDDGGEDRGEETGSHLGTVTTP